VVEHFSQTWAWRPWIAWACAGLLGLACVVYAFREFQARGKVLVVAAVAVSVSLPFLYPAHETKMISFACVLTVGILAYLSARIEEIKSKIWW